MKTRKLSIRWKLLLSISLLSIACCCVLGGVSYYRISGMMIEEIKENAMSTAKVASYEIDGEEFESISEPEGKAYEHVFGQLAKYKEGYQIEYIYSMRLKEGTPVFVVDTDEEDPADYEEEYEMLEDMKPAFEGEVSCDRELTRDEWGEYFSAYAPVKKGEEVVGIVGCDVGVESVNESLAKLRVTILVIVGVCVLACILFALLISSNISKNLKQLFSKVKELNSGSGDLTRTIVIRSGDELETIAEELNTFLNEVQNLVSHVASSAHAVKASGTDVTQLAEENRNQIENISKVLESLNESMKQTSENANRISGHIASTMEEVSTLRGRAGEASESVQEESEKATGMKQEIAQVKGETQEMIRNLQNQMELAAGRCEAIRQIDAITEEILKVASKTKILSLNAHTEAARAGVAGSGFAVIADSISDLSNQISNLIKSIQETNAEVQGAVDELIAHVNEVSQFLTENVINDYNEFVTFGEEYYTSMTEMSQMLIKFSSATEHVNQTMEQIGDMVTEIDSVINDATGEISNVFERSVELKGQTGKLQDIANGNSDESERMTSRIEKYHY